MSDCTPDSLRAYLVEHGPWVRADLIEPFADAWEAQEQSWTAAYVATICRDNAALRQRLEAEVKLQIEFRKGLLEQNGLVLTLNRRLQDVEKRRDEAFYACDILRQRLEVAETPSEADKELYRNDVVVFNLANMLAKSTLEYGAEKVRSAVRCAAALAAGRE